MKSISKYLKSLGMGLVALTCFAAQANAGVILGKDLPSTTNVSLPNGHSAITGNSIRFQGSPNNKINVLVDLSALNYGVGPGQTTSGTVAISNTRISSDSDIWIGLWDGSVFDSITSWDGNRSSSYNGGSISGGSMSYGTNNGTVSFTTNQNINDTVMMTYTFDLVNKTTSLNVGGITNNQVISAGFNTSNNIQFVIGNGSTGEIIQIDSIDINGLGTAPVPEPSTYALLALGLVGLGAYSRKRRK